MSTMPAVIVKKGGFLSALFTGFFSFLVVVVICASGLGFYALHSANNIVEGVFGVTGNVITGIPEWQDKLPPLLAETLDDRRAPDYRGSVEIETRLISLPSERSQFATMIEVSNNGAETITLLSMNVTLENVDGVPLSERRVYAATPITVDQDDWRGPLMASESRKFIVHHSRRHFSVDDVLSLEARISVGDLRLWNGPRQQAAELVVMD